MAWPLCVEWSAVVEAEMAFCTWQIKVEPDQAAWSWRLPCTNPAVTSEGLLYSRPHVNMGTLVPATFQTVCSLSRGWENTRPH